MPKYKITESHIDSPSNYVKLLSDGFTKEAISKAFYKATYGASRTDRRWLMGNLYGHSRPKPKGL